MTSRPRATTARLRRSFESLPAASPSKPATTVPGCRLSTESSCRADNSRPGLGNRAYFRRNSKAKSSARDGEGVDRSLYDDNPTITMLRSRQRLVQVDRLVVKNGSWRVLVLRPARIADVAAYQAREAFFGGAKR